MTVRLDPTGSSRTRCVSGWWKLRPITRFTSYATWPAGSSVRRCAAGAPTTATSGPKCSALARGLPPATADASSGVTTGVAAVPAAHVAVMQAEAVPLGMAWGSTAAMASGHGPSSASASC
eukprot:scaffold1392_cov356-Prasinococcus_capsulatus_cf.AAC.2